MRRFKPSTQSPRNHIGMSIRAFARLSWHLYVTGISVDESKEGIVCEATWAIDRDLCTDWDQPRDFKARVTGPHPWAGNSHIRVQVARFASVS